VQLRDLSTPALIVDPDSFEHNVTVMGEQWPGRSLRPHVKAFKSTALAGLLADRGHTGFCCATVREIEGMAGAGLGDDLLLANEVLDTRRLGSLVSSGAARVTVAVDSDETVDAAAAGGVGEVLIDVNVGLPRCGCEPDDAARLADRARRAGLTVRGVMGYEGHVVGLEDRTEREEQTEKSMSLLLESHVAVGGDIVSGGGTGTWDINRWITELQAGSFTLMDTAYAKLGMPFRQALYVLGTVISVNTRSGFAVADVGLKSLGMDHGNPTIDDATVWFCSDEHITFGPPRGGAFAEWHVRVGDRVQVWPAHVDPTIALHDRLHVIETSGATAGRVALDPEAEIVDTWPVDLRNW
jgi:D-serine deaminase-like pyridoxal phosphate-dependent protein